MCPLQRSEVDQARARETMNAISRVQLLYMQLRKSPYLSPDFVEWLQQCDGRDAEDPPESQTFLSSKQRKKAYNSMKRKTHVPSCTAPMWRDAKQTFNERSVQEILETIFVLMMEEYDGCDEE